MNLITKLLATVGILFVFGIIITVLYESGGVAPGDGPISFILFGGMIVAIIFVWKSAPPKNTSK